jgi:hypothetical protein
VPPRKASALVASAVRDGISFDHGGVTGGQPVLLPVVDARSAGGPRIVFLRVMT